jgi:formate dehydrogenase assembly factor FdhD
MKANPVVDAGVAQVNKGKQQAVEARAAQLVNDILSDQGKIADREKMIAANRVELEKLSRAAITVISVFGSPFSPELNPNEKTISDVIARMNEGNQKMVEATASFHASAIVNEQESIKVIETRIARSRKELSELSSDSITITQVTG